MKSLAVSLMALVALGGCSMLGLDHDNASHANKSNECGRISTFWLPPQSQDLYPVKIDQIDGKSVAYRSLYRLDPGEHKIKVFDQIDDPRLDAKLANNESKTLTITVRANKRYHLAAHFNAQKRFSHDQYWQPKVWKTTDQQCSIKEK